MCSAANYRWRFKGYDIWLPAKSVLFSNWIKLTIVRGRLLKTLTSVLSQNEQNEQIEIMANHCVKG